MNREKIKSLTLLSLVLLSVILTTRIWFDTSMKGIFVMFQNNGQTTPAPDNYDIGSLVKPDRIYLNDGSNTKQLDAAKSTELYNKIFSNTRNILMDLSQSTELVPFQKQKLKNWYALKENRGIEVCFDFHMEADNFLYLIGIDKNPWPDIKYIDAIFLSATSNKLYILDKSQDAFYELSTSKAQKNLEYLLAEGEKQNTLSLVPFNELNPELYSPNVTAPILTSLPVLLETKDISLDSGAISEKMPDAIAKFFDKKATISSIRNSDGTFVYTDREEKEERWVWIYTDGVVEYKRYITAPADSSIITARDAVQMSIDFANNHFGIPEGCYISDIDKIEQDGRLSGYVIKFKYRYEGIPLIFSDAKSASAIEVEVTGKTITRFKHVARTITEKTEVKDIMNPVVAQDSILNNEKSHILITDIKAAYLERNNKFTPVWVVDVTVDSSGTNSTQKLKKQYFINTDSSIVETR